MARPDEPLRERALDRLAWLTASRDGVEALRPAELVRVIRYAQSHRIEGSGLVDEAATELVRIELRGTSGERGHT
jgi:hypothetical protein